MSPAKCSSPAPTAVPRWRRHRASLAHLARHGRRTATKAPTPTRCSPTSASTRPRSPRSAPPRRSPEVAHVLDGRTPVVVGVGVAQQRCDDPRDGVDAVGLMIDAVDAAGADSGRPELLRAAQLVAVPKGTWRERDPGRRVAAHVGARDARTARFELGVLQQSLLARAARAIRDDGLDVAIV